MIDSSCMHLYKKAGGSMGVFAVYMDPIKFQLQFPVSFRIILSNCSSPPPYLASDCDQKERLLFIQSDDSSSLCMLQSLCTTD